MIRRQHSSILKSVQFSRIKLEVADTVSVLKELQPNCSLPHHNLLSTETMDFFATLFSIALDTADTEPAPSTPIDASGGNGSGNCIVA